MKKARKHQNKAVVHADNTIKTIRLAQLIIGLFVVSVVLYTIVSGNHFLSQQNVLAFLSNTQVKTEYIQANRGYIYDRNKEVIAQDVDRYTMYAVLDESRMGIGDVPAYVVDPELTAQQLSPILECSVDKLKGYMAQDVYQTYFGFCGKNLSASQREKIEALELPGIEFEHSIDRVYPTGVFASHLIGYAQYDESAQTIVGRMGVEALYDELLQGENGIKKSTKDANNLSLPGTSYYEKKPVNGDDVYLTIDKNVQVALESALEQTVSKLGATKAWSVIMEVETGRILGWAQAPGFDLNEREIEDYLNMPAQYVFEPGSVMKSLVYSAAMDVGVYDGTASVMTGKFHVGLDGSGKTIRLPSATGAIGTINDANRKGWGVINYDDALVRSSNTAIAELLTTRLDPSVLETYLDAFKLFEPIEMDGVKTSVGTKNYIWPFDKLATGFGQGSSVTTLNLMQAYSAIFNDGAMVKPYFIEKVVSGEDGSILEQNETEIVGNPIQKSTADQMLALLQRVVEEPYGTARTYRLNDTTLVAKTGTAEMAVNGQYGNTYISSVMAAAPAEDPKVMMYYAFENKNPTNLTGEFFQQAFMQALLSLNVAGDKYEEDVENNHNNPYREYVMENYRNHSVEYSVGQLRSFGTQPVVIGDGATVIDQFPQANSASSTFQKTFLLTDGTTIKMPNMIGWTRKEVSAFWQLSGIPITMEGFGTVYEQNFAVNETISKSYEIVVKLQ
ncbi:MAG: penicillin-binding transpeptidase domain-containing protein [Erysipelotrichaceae bacterium]